MHSHFVNNTICAWHACLRPMTFIMLKQFPEVLSALCSLPFPKISSGVFLKEYHMFGCLSNLFLLSLECSPSKIQWSQLNAWRYWSQQFRQVGLYLFNRFILDFRTLASAYESVRIFFCNWTTRYIDFLIHFQCGSKRRQEVAHCALPWWSRWTGIHTQGDIHFGWSTLKYSFVSHRFW